MRVSATELQMPHPRWASYSCAPRSAWGVPKRAMSSKGEQRCGLSSTAPELRQGRSMGRKRGEIPHCRPGPPAHTGTRGLAEAATSLMGGGPPPSWPCPSAWHTSLTGHPRGCTHSLEGCMSDAGVLFNFFLPVTSELGLQFGL